MQLLEAFAVKKHFGDRLILCVDTLQIYEGDKIGIVGLNGVGKTTLLQILSGELEPDEGTVRRLCSVSYLKQFEQTLGDTAALNQKLLGEMNVKNKLERSALSGGERTRIKLSHALSSSAPLLFADEPTANLDISGIEILEKKLKKAKSLLLISHDKQLLDSVCNKILEIKDGKIAVFIGNYTDYVMQKAVETEHENAQFERYISQKNHLTNSVQNAKSKAAAMKKAPTRMGNSEARLHKREATQIAGKLHCASKAMETRLEKLEVREKPKEMQSIKLDFSLTNPPKNKLVITANGFNFSYENNVIFKNASFSVNNSRHIALLGENGSGKTTLLNAVFHGNSAITTVPAAKLGYFRQGFENLNFKLTVLENVMENSVQNETTARTILARLLLTQADVNKKVSVLSGGERIKVAFAKLFVSDANVLLLDEPTNYLDMPSVTALTSILEDYSGTILFVSHDRNFVQTLANGLIFVKNKKCESFDGGILEYKERQAKKLTKTTGSSTITDTEKLILELRLAQIVSKISSGENANKQLEEEYDIIMERLNRGKYSFQKNL